MMKYAPSSELMRVAEQRNANHIRKQAWMARSVKHRYGEKQDMYRDKKVCAEYERFLNDIGHP